jgi:hypothetical protein
MSDGEIAQIPEELDAYFYDTMDWGWTTDEEYALMAKLKKGKAKAEGKEKSKIDLKPEYEIGNAEKDKELMQKTFTYSTTLSSNVGKGQKNEKNDVKIISNKLNELGYKNIPKSCLENGDWDDKLTKAIKNFQTNGKGPGYNARYVYLTKKIAARLSGIVEVNSPTFKALFRHSGLDLIYMKRSTVDNYIKSVSLKISNEVGEKRKNNIEDVKLIALLLAENNIKDVPKASLEKGEWVKELGTKISEFQTKNKMKAFGWVNPKGTTFKKLSRIRNSKNAGLKRLKYDLKTQKHDSFESRHDYEGKLEKLKNNLGIEKDSNYDLIFKMANKAAIDNNYYDEITKDVAVSLKDANKYNKDEEVQLSPLLVERMRRFHKFLVAAGLYNGNMKVVDGARSAKRAHRWSVEYQIEQGVHKKDVKKNLIKMFKDKNYHKGEYIRDLDDNLWAKKEHFYTYYGDDPGYKTKSEYDIAIKKEKTDNKNEKKTKINNVQKTGILWTDVYNYVVAYTIKKRGENIKNFRKSSSKAASEGYRAGTKKRLPSSNSVNTSNHVGGEAIDISSGGFLMKTETMIDLIGLCFGLIRAGGAGEGWHFELTGVEPIKENKKYMKNSEPKKK